MACGKLPLLESKFAYGYCHKCDELIEDGHDYIIFTRDNPPSKFLFHQGCITDEKEILEYVSGNLVPYEPSERT